jgi:hypothetical protein
MPRTSSRFAPPWGILPSTIVAGIFAVIAHDLLMWQLPRVSPHGVGLILLAGLALGVFGLLRRPSWQVRAASLATLVVAAIVLNPCWFRAIDRVNLGYSFRQQEDDLLSTRYYKHDHWIPRQASAYFVMADLLEGKQIRYIEGAWLSKWRLAALARPSGIVEVDPPGYPLPSAQELWNGYPNRKFRLHSPDWGGRRSSTGWSASRKARKRPSTSWCWRWTVSTS